MSIKKLENSSDHAMVAEEVKILTNLLNESTRQLSGDVIFNKIQDLIKISAQKDYDALEKQIASLTNQEMIVVARYFATLPNYIINIYKNLSSSTCRVAEYVFFSSANGTFMKIHIILGHEINFNKLQKK